MMILGVATAFQNFSPSSNNVMQAATISSEPLAWVNTGGKLPLDLQLDLDKRLDRESPKVRDSINIIDSVRWETKIRWKTRYKNVADRTAAREAGEHLVSVTPDSLPNSLAITSTVGREEKPIETVGTSKVSSILLAVDGEVVYSRNENNSAEEGQ